MPRRPHTAPVDGGGDAYAHRVSYSRGADGRAPSTPSANSQQQIFSLLSSTKGMAGQRDYGSAIDSWGQIDALRFSDERARLSAERTRQREEKQRLDQAFREEQRRFEGEWGQKLSDVEARAAEKQRVLAEVHEVQRAELDAALATKEVRLGRFKASCMLLQLEDTERRLGLAHEFKQAEEVRQRAARQRKLEEEAFLVRKAKQLALPRQVLQAKQATETDILVQKCYAFKINERRGKVTTSKLLKQRYVNLGADLEHAHAIEMHLPAEIGAVLAQPSRSSNASTFRGTLKFESLKGTKFDAPDISRMQPIPS